MPEVDCDRYGWAISQPPLEQSVCFGLLSAYTLRDALAQPLLSISYNHIMSAEGTSEGTPNLIVHELSWWEQLKRSSVFTCVCETLAGILPSSCHCGRGMGGNYSKQSLLFWLV